MIEMAIHLILTAVLMAVPPLTEAQKLQLDSARDELTTTDEGALYPLLENALSWPAQTQTGAMIPDYDALEKDPASQRGQLFFITGKLLRSQPIGRLALPGPWDGRLTEWAIQWGDDPTQTVIVNLVDPPAHAKDGVKVQLAARFYKRWPTVNKLDQPRVFLVFVGKDAQVLGVTPGMGSKGVYQALALVLVMAVFGLFWIIRKSPSMSLQPRPTQRQLLRRQAREQHDEPHAQESAPVDSQLDMDDHAEAQVTPPLNAFDHAPLPVDPALALAKLQASQKDAAATDTNNNSTSPS